MIVFGDIKTDTVTIGTKLSIWNATNLASIESYSIQDNGISIKATPSEQEKTYQFYRVSTVTPFKVSMLGINANSANFTIKQGSLNDVTLNITGTQIAGLKLDGVTSNSWHYNSGTGINVITIGSAHTVQVIFVGTTCGLSFTSGAPINFGTLARDIISYEQTLVLYNTGDLTATITVSGNNWKDGSNVDHIAGQLTKFATSDQGTILYSSKKALNNTNGDVAFGTIRPQYTNSTYWQVQAVLQNMPFSGILTQSITFTTTC